MRPNFLIIGAMKCATTTLWEILRRHPQISMPSQKDPAFFCIDEQFARGWDWYEGQFPDAAGRAAIGECTVGYTKQILYPNTARRIAEHLPHVKLIYIVRNPLERIESHWRHNLGHGHYIPSFDGFVRNNPEVVDTSCYWRQIGAYRAHFPDEQILVLFFEEFVKHPEAVLKRCFEFLGVDDALSRADYELAANVSKDARMDGSLIRYARKLPGVQLLKRAAPAISTSVGWRLRRTMPDRPIWTAELRRQVIDLLADDPALFLRHYGKPAGWWRLD